MQTSSDVAISIHDVAKRYELGKEVRPLTLRDRITEAASGLVRKSPGEPSREFWALSDITFDIPSGAVFGLIGRNGAGKSTLLKILSRITEPTRGTVEIFGRVATLLEVGTGFHPELSGRENIFLNGSILGMSRREIRAKFDEIVAFSEIERFIDTPVKRYSSGMYVRLAFAVAAHLDPDILLVDEVLAVGDAAFQRKCLGKMQNVSRSGRTVVMVSHNMTVVSQLCDTVAWIDGGHLRELGRAPKVIANYLSQGIASSLTWTPPPHDGPYVFGEIGIDDPSGTGAFASDEAVTLRIDVTVKPLAPPSHISVHIFSEDGALLFNSTSADGKVPVNQPFIAGPHTLTCTIPPNLLKPGRYIVTLWVPTATQHMAFENILSFVITEERCANYGAAWGLVAPLLRWSDELHENEAPAAPGGSGR